MSESSIRSVKDSYDAIWSYCSGEGVPGGIKSKAHKGRKTIYLVVKQCRFGDEVTDCLMSAWKSREKAHGACVKLGRADCFVVEMSIEDDRKKAKGAGKKMKKKKRHGKPASIESDKIAGVPMAMTDKSECGCGEDAVRCGLCGAKTTPGKKCPKCKTKSKAPSRLLTF